MHQQRVHNSCDHQRGSWVCHQRCALCQAAADDGACCYAERPAEEPRPDGLVVKVIALIEKLACPAEEAAHTNIHVSCMRSCTVSCMVSKRCWLSGSSQLLQGWRSTVAGLLQLYDGLVGLLKQRSAHAATLPGATVVHMQRVVRIPCSRSLPDDTTS